MVIRSLLIVPYGIETATESSLIAGIWLLIVPYGIETQFLPILQHLVNHLLIVPYGIETLATLYCTHTRSPF